MVQSPCKDCNDRYESCHAICDKYISWKTAWTEHKRVINKGRMKEAELCRLRNESIARMRH